MNDGVVTRRASRHRGRTPDPLRTPAPSGLAWRVLDDGPLDGARNMALDEALARECVEGRAVLRLYSWARPTVSFGRNEPALGVYSGRRIEEEGFDCVRRPTGGRAVLHAEEVTYAIVMPIRSAGGVRETYARINRALVDALTTVGARVRMSDEARVAPLDAGPCFGIPAPGEVVAEGKKIVGSAQARVGSALLQHGSVLLAGDQSPLDRVRTDASGAGEDAGGTGGGRSTSVEALVGPVVERDVRREVARAVEREFGGGWEQEGEYTAAERALAETLMEDRYVDEGWTWRR